MDYTDDLEYEKHCFHKDNKKLNTYLNKEIKKLEDMELRIMKEDSEADSRIKDINFGRLMAFKKVLDFIKNDYKEEEN